jgi:predicted transcriptional regulator
MKPSVISFEDYVILEVIETLAELATPKLIERTVRVQYRPRVPIILKKLVDTGLISRFDRNPYELTSAGRVALDQARRFEIETVL